MTQEIQPIKSTLIAMNVGDTAQFPKERRKSVRTTASDIKADYGRVFKTDVKDNVIIVTRKN